VYVLPLGVVHLCQPGLGWVTFQPGDCFTRWHFLLRAPALQLQVRPPLSYPSLPLIAPQFAMPGRAGESVRGPGSARSGSSSRSGNRLSARPRAFVRLPAHRPLLIDHDLA
jgi:hypothetical protein